jgi:serine/threonine protein phosphatase PrpC
MSSATSIEAKFLTDIGQERSNNEDCVFAQTYDSKVIRSMSIVADGVGGQAGGELASAAVLEIARKYLDESVNEISNADQIPELLAYILKQANKDVRQLVSESASSPASTATICVTTESSYYIGHVGDSRAYLIDDRGAVQLTLDDSYVAEEVRKGTLTEKEAQRSPFRSHITKSVGTVADIEPSYYTGKFPTGSSILLCSDGLSEYVDGKDLHKIVQRNVELDSICNKLVHEANVRGGHDNISVAITRRPGPRSATATQRRKTASRSQINNPSNSKPSPEMNKVIRFLTEPLGFVFILVLVAAIVVTGIYWKRTHPDKNIKPRALATKGPGVAPSHIQKRTGKSFVLNVVVRDHEIYLAFKEPNLKVDRDDCKAQLDQNGHYVLSPENEKMILDQLKKGSKIYLLNKTTRKGSKTSIDDRTPTLMFQIGDEICWGSYDENKLPPLDVLVEGHVIKGIPDAIDDSQNERSTGADNTGAQQ